MLLTWYSHHQLGLLNERVHVGDNISDFDSDFAVLPILQERYYFVVDESPSILTPLYTLPNDPEPISSMNLIFSCGMFNRSRMAKFTKAAISL